MINETEKQTTEGDVRHLHRQFFSISDIQTPRIR